MFRSPRTLFDQHVVLNVEIELQDPLNPIPLLISCDDPAVGDLLSLIRERCSAKEAVIAVQEAVERLEVSSTPMTMDLKKWNKRYLNRRLPRQ